MENKSKITIGLIGNPNVGKTTLFNMLTGSHQRISNWPGVTVEKTEGSLNVKGEDITLVDLPGAYSLSAYSEDEMITSTFLYDDKPDLIVQVIDAQDLSRNLYLTIQLLEAGTPLLLAINMSELASVVIDVKELSKLLRIPVIMCDVRKKTDISTLMNKSVDYIQSKNISSGNPFVYSKNILEQINIIKTFLNQNYNTLFHNNIWLAVKLIERDIFAKKRISKEKNNDTLRSLLKQSRDCLEKNYNKDVHTIFTNERYNYINKIVGFVTQKKKVNNSASWQGTLDNFVMNKYFGVPLFLIIMYGIFQTTFALSLPLMDFIDNKFGLLNVFVREYLVSLNSSPLFISLITDGILSGVSGVLIFVPIIAILFILIAILEDTGYMARVAYVMDKLMQKIGLHGKAFIPLVLGFGCTVPAIMSTRTLESKQDRLLTILISPFISCSARLPVYLLFTSIFFTHYLGLVVFSLYLLGVLVAIVMGLVFKKFLFKGAVSAFVIELPSYKLPMLRSISVYVWEKVWAFIKNAGTVIVAFSIIIWFFASFPSGTEYGSRDTYVGQFGETISPVFAPIGVANWQSSVALTFGFVAKEVIIGSFGTLYGAVDTAGETDELSLRTALQNDFTPLSAYSFMVFVLLYIPCVATLATVRKETQSYQWPIFMVFYTFAIAWFMSFLIYQGGLLLGFV